MKKLLLALLVATVAVPAATAGGWATVGLSSLPPAGLGPGQDWPLDVTVLQHGRTPLAGVHPTVTVRNLRSGEAAGTFAATPTGEPGVYHTVVRFPAKGTWTYEVYDAFTQYGGARTHTFKPVEIAAGGSGSGFPTLPVGAGFLGAALLGAVLYLRWLRSTPAPAISSR